MTILYSAVINTVLHPVKHQLIHQIAIASQKQIIMPCSTTTTSQAVNTGTAEEQRLKIEFDSLSLKHQYRLTFARGFVACCSPSNHVLLDFSAINSPCFISLLGCIRTLAPREFVFVRGSGKLAWLLTHAITNSPRRRP